MLCVCVGDVMDVVILLGLILILSTVISVTKRAVPSYPG